MRLARVWMIASIWKVYTTVTRPPQGMRERLTTKGVVVIETAGFTVEQNTWIAPDAGICYSHNQLLYRCVRVQTLLMRLSEAEREHNLKLGCLIAALLPLMLMADLISADPTALDDGVLIAHHPPGLEFTSGQDWCDRYEQEFAIDSCEAQHNRIDLDGNQGDGSVWYVLAAWEEAKEWCAVEFGLGAYTAANYPLVEHGPCGSGALTIPTSGWPNFVPVYFFAGYAYGEDLIPLSVDPAQNFAGFSNCAAPPETWSASALGGMGLFTDGIYACGGGGEGLDGGGDAPDGQGSDSLPMSLDWCAPRSVLIRFAPNEVRFPAENPRGHEYFFVPLSEAEFERADLRSQLIELGVEGFETVAPNWRHMTEEDQVDIHGRRVSLVDFTDVYRLTLTGRASVAQTIAALTGRTGIEYVECDPLPNPMHVPNDSLFASQWYLNNTGQGGCPVGFDVNAPEAWDIQDSAGTKIGISDYAINPLVLGIEGYIDSTLSRSFIPTESDWWTTDTGSHGTHVASVAAAGTDDSVSIASLTNLQPNHADRLIVGLRVAVYPWDHDSVAVRGARALDYVCSDEVNKAIRVVNHSWGSPSCKYEYEYNKTLRDAFGNAFYSDICLVCASGNVPGCHSDSGCVVGDSCFAYPAAFDDYALAVAAVDCDGDTDPFYKKGSYIDLAAPGAGIYYLDSDGVHYDPRWATSWSAPLASAALSLVLGADPSLTNEDCYSVLKLTAMPTYGSSPILTGAGLLNAAAALSMVTPPHHVRRDSTDTRTLEYIDSWPVAFVNVDSIITPEPEHPETLWVNAHRLVSSVTIPDSVVVGHFWARGKSCSGWRLIDGSLNGYYDARFYANYAAVDSVFGNTAWFSSYTYEVYEEPGGSFLGWYPYDPDSTYQLAYSYVTGDGISAVGDRSPHEPPRSRRVQVWRRAGEVLLQFESDREVPSMVSIYDAAGRQVRTILSRKGTGEGPTTVSWDERDKMGRAVVSGIYFVKVIPGQKLGAGYWLRRASWLFDRASNQRR